jgi:signal-transduction protein with cAMP-binding, CBS, and nucleotidyltransferase domain
MAKNGIRHLMVEHGNNIIEMITTTDLYRYVKEELQDKERVSCSILELLLYSSK